MTAPLVARVTARCAGCGACLLTCPVHAIRPHGAPLDVRPDLCTGCGECVEVCPVDAIDLDPRPVPPTPRRPR
ncbi:MAG TPA: 4Fe-4S dicluster domain-containing protein [Streptosporangiaceae bacterium]|jgi:ferredoxin